MNALRVVWWLVHLNMYSVSLDIQYRLDTVNGNGMTFMIDWWIKLLKHKGKCSFSNELIKASTLKLFAQRDTWKRMVGITLAYAGLFGRCMDQHEPTVGNLVGPMSKMTSGKRYLSTSNQQNCQENANIAPTDDFI